MLTVIAALLAAQAAQAAPPATEPPRAEAQSKATPPAKSEEKKEPAKPIFHPTEVRSTGSVTIGGRRIPYNAVAGTLVVHSKGWEDTDALEAAANPADEADDKDDKPKAEGSMFYVAYFKSGAPSANRPITFLFNGGPGSSTVWLHMGAFGPQRVQTFDERHTPAPYSLINNDQSLLDASDLVFIDAPGTGFSRIAGKEKERRSTESTRTSTPSRNSSPSSCPSTTAGTRPNMCSARVTGRCAARASRWRFRRATSTSTA